MPTNVPPWIEKNAELLLSMLMVLLFSFFLWILVNLGIRAIIKLAEKRAAAHDAACPNRFERVLSSATGFQLERSQQRTRTLGSIMRSVSAFVIGAVALITILGKVGLPLGPLLASAGVGGVAIGFGAQSLVKDFLSGIAMLVEDQYGVGDFIDTGEVSGTVEEVGLRVTRLRDATGMVWYVRNGEVTRIGNHSQGWTTAMIDLPISYDEDPAVASQVLQDMVNGLDMEQPWAKPLLERPVVLGVDSVVGTAMTMRLMIKTAPNQHWAVQRELRLRAKDALAAADIKGPAAVPGLQP